MLVKAPGEIAPNQRVAAVGDFLHQQVTALTAQERFEQTFGAGQSSTTWVVPTANAGVMFHMEHGSVRPPTDVETASQIDIYMLPRGGTVMGRYALFHASRQVDVIPDPQTAKLFPPSALYEATHTERPGQLLVWMGQQAGRGVNGKITYTEATIRPLHTAPNVFTAVSISTYRQRALSIAASEARLRLSTISLPEPTPLTLDVVTGNSFKDQDRRLFELTYGIAGTAVRNEEMRPEISAVSLQRLFDQGRELVHLAQAQMMNGHNRHHRTAA